VETAPVEKNDGGERQRTTVRSVNMEKHYTHKNVSSTRKHRKRERERERVTFFDFAGDRSGRQIRRRNEPASQRERTTVSQRERERERESVCAGDRFGCQICRRNETAGQRERMTCAPETEGAVSHR
jgi:hypothetical protein